MKVIGLTGNIACGKSSLAALLEQHGVPVLDSDLVTAELYQDSQVQEEIQAGFATLDKQKIAQMVFGNTEQANTKRKELEAIIHPRVERRFQEWLKENQSADFVVNVLPLLFEAGLEGRYDYIVTITCDQSQQIERLKQRNPDLSEAEIAKRIQSQLAQEQKVAKSDYILDNSKDLQALEREFKKLMIELKKLV